MSLLKDELILKGISILFSEPLENEEMEDEPLDNDEMEDEQLERDRVTPDVPERERTNVKRTPWTEEERSAVRRQLEKFFSLDRLPGKHEILEAQRKEAILQRRPWTQIKFFIKNEKVALKRKL